MSVADGNWNVTVKTPMGEQEIVLTLKTDGGQLSGTAKAMGGELPLENGKVNGNAVSYAVKLTKPMPVTLNIEAEINGDEMSGKAKAGPFGSFALEGKRA